MLADLAAKHGFKFGTLDGGIKHPTAELIGWNPSRVSGTWRPTRTPPAPGKKPSSGSWLHSSAHYRLSQVRKARSSAAKSAVCKTPNCRRIKSFDSDTRHRGRYPRPWRRLAPKGANTTGSD